ncbi:MAG: methanogenesis marker protein Mmp4/MtxX [Euryarchaeota archaeon]|nr:methanogenesis marker protein Mmp4/MtxX [Euryarchaeota archaeon]
MTVKEAGSPNRREEGTNAGCLALQSGEEVTLLDEIADRARVSGARVGVGVAADALSKSVLADIRSASEFAEIVLIGKAEQIRTIDTDLGTVSSENPELELVRQLADGRIDAAVRGTLSATKTLSHLKDVFGVPALQRLALLTTADGTPFFLAPVGIDEGNSLDDKIELICKSAAYIATKFGIHLRVAVLSGGRFEDVGRSATVDQSLADGEFVAGKLRELGIDAKHYGILIEDAIKDANFIVAPDGITGNLIFRTLTFIGGGNGFGAPVLMEPVFVDTSRVKTNLSNAIMLASALAWTDDH